MAEVGCNLKLCKFNQVVGMDDFYAPLSPGVVRTLTVARTWS